MRPLIAVAVAVAAALSVAAVHAEPPAPFRATLTLKDHRFTPETIAAPAGTRIIITLINQDSSSEEFDSDDLHKEEDVTPRGKVTFTVGPLAPGSYDFMGEAHPGTALGRIVVAPPSP